MAGTVVVGAGLAAAHVVATLREAGYADPVTLVGEEVDRPYERPPLSKAYLQGSAPRDDVFVHADGWYADHGVETRFGTAATAVDRAARTVALADGTTLGYDHLVIATGSSPRTLDVPGAGLDGVHTLRRLGDSDVLRDELATRSRLVVAGGGWIGLEVAAAARLAGLDVTVLEYAAQPLLRVLGPELGAFFADLHREHGVDVRTGVGVEAFEGSAGRVTGVRVGGEVVPADVVLVGVGAAPNIGLAARGRPRGGPRRRHHRRRAPADRRSRGARGGGRRPRVQHRARAQPARRALGQRDPPGCPRRAVDPGPGRGPRLAAVLLHRPVRPRHGVRRARRRGRPVVVRGDLRRTGDHRVLAARRARPSRDERQRLGRQRAAARARRAADRARSAGAPRTCRSTRSSPRSPPGCCARG